MSKLKKTDKMDSEITVIPGFDPSANGDIVGFGTCRMWSEISDCKPRYRYQQIAGTTTHTDYHKALAAVKRAFWHHYGNAGCIRMYLTENAKYWSFHIIIKIYPREDPLPGARILTAEEVGRAINAADALLARMLLEQQIAAREK
ncbi:MAG: hypothetical protein WC340_15690 [Kiritimatiellia bacterium]